MPLVRQDKNNGFILLSSLLLVAMVMTLATAGMTRSLTELAVANQVVRSQQVFQAAEGGLDQATQWLTSLDAPPLETAPFWLLCNPGSACVKRSTPFTHTLEPVRYSIRADPDAANPTSSFRRFTFTVQASNPSASVTRTVSAVLQTDSFAHYAWFENHDTSTLYPDQHNWWRNSTVEGPFHSNGQINVWGSPLFQGPASSVATTLRCMNGCPPDAPQFTQGVMLGVSPIPMPTMALDALREQAQVLGSLLSGDTTVSIDRNVLFVTNAEKGWLDHPVLVSDAPLVYVQPDGAGQGTLTLTGGTLTGQLTLGSDQDIYITADTAYTCNPEDPLADAADCVSPLTGEVAYDNDVLGLIARQNVVISQYAAHHVSIQGTIMAVEGDFRTENVAALDTKGTLHVYGSIIQNTVGATGYIFPDTTKVHGYAVEDFHFDTRLQDRLSPPFYPSTGTYTHVMWKEE